VKSLRNNCSITSYFASPLNFKKMVRNYGFIVCLVVIVMDVVAGILGIQAEIAQNKVLQNS
jgi:hypothetical protein